MLDEEKPERPVTLDFINQEIQRTLQRQQDTRMIGNIQHAPVQTQAIHSQQHKGKKVVNSPKEESKTPSTPCWFCGAMHYSKFCQFKNHKCKQCDRVGHKEGYCNAKSNNSKQKNSKAINRQSQTTTSANNKHTNSNKNSHAQTRTIDNSVDNLFHRKYVNVLINSKNVELQLDTASDISIRKKLDSYQSSNIKHNEANSQRCKW